MAEAHDLNLHSMRLRKEPQETADLSMHPAWMRLIRYCTELGHGEIEKLKIQDGLPMAAEVTTKKIKFSP
jgi:hypothetical protein